MANGVSIDLIVDPKKALAGLDAVGGKSSALADGLKGLGGVAAAGIAALGATAVAGAAALGTAVVHAYSDYQQLAGGVQKLFGDASSTVTKFAQNAATSAGLSTNQYMDTVTSFSASLIAGLHGDQQAAAASANVAITDMADNANTFGTSIDSIQLAYQGFAKGNFTMLDNLKLGFGGSQQGMADLINTSGVLGSSFKVTAETVKDVPFDKMIEAIHQVQANMNIAGTTAREAASTIAGSFDATKASLTNLVTGLGIADSDFSSLVGNLATNAQNLVNNVAPVIANLATAVPQVVPVLLSAIQQALPALLPLAANLISSLLTGIVQAAPQLIGGAVPIVLGLVTALIGLLPDLVDAGSKILVSLIQGISDALPTLIPAAVSAVVGLVQALVNNLPLILNAALQLITGLAQGFLKSYPVLIAALPGLIVGIVKFLIDAIPQLIDAGITLLTSLVGALPDIITAIVAAIPQIIVGIGLALVNAIPKLILAGIRLFTSLIDNLPEIIRQLVAAIPQIIVGIVQAVSNPSTQKAMAEAGMELIKGLWQGITDLAGWLWSKISGFANTLIDNVKKLFGIHSPSTVFASIGGNLISGLVNGITDGSGLVTSTMSGLSKQVTDGFGADLNVQARASVSGGFDQTAAAAGGTGKVPQLSQTIYMLPEQDPRIVGRQMGREYLRGAAGGVS